jgi:hypothetical protein
MTQQDRFGTHFETPDGKPPSQTGIPINVYTPEGVKSGWWDGSNGSAQVNK